MHIGIILGFWGCSTKGSVLLESESTASEDTALPSEPTPAEPEDSAPEDTAPLEDTAFETDTAEEAEPENAPTSEPEMQAPEGDCGTTSSHIYLLLDETDHPLYTFDPQTLLFELVGTLDCAIFGTPTHIAAARDGFLYVAYSDTSLYQLDLQDMSCIELDAPILPISGMAFVGQSNRLWEETLFVSTQEELQTLSPSSSVGYLPASLLSGTPQGTLWSLQPTTLLLAEISTSNAQSQNSFSVQEVASTNEIDNLAFAHWNEEFYFFVRKYGLGNSSDIYKATAQGSVESVLPQSGYTIVSATASSCDIE